MRDLGTDSTLHVIVAFSPKKEYRFMTEDWWYIVYCKTQIYTYSFIRRHKYSCFLWTMLACSCSCIHLRDRRNNRKSIEPVLIRQENEWFFFFETTMHDVMRFMSTFRKMSWKWFDNFYKVKRITVPDSINFTLTFTTFSIKNVIWNKCEKASKIADSKCRNDTWEGCNSMIRRKMHLPLNLGEVQ